MTCLIKIINFVYEDEKKKIKFRCDASRDLIDGLIRHEFGIATNIDYSPRSKMTGRFRQETIGNRWNVEAVFPSENFRIFSDHFRAVPAGKRGKLTRIHRKKSGKFPVGVLLPLPAIFVAFLQDPAGSSGRNFRHGPWWI